MARIGLTEGFSLVPEGDYVFKIVDAVYKEEFGKLEVKMKTQDGRTHIERFSLVGKKGEPNTGAMNAFSYFAKTALNDFSATEIDEKDLIGHFVLCTVEHEEVPNNKNPEKMMTFAHLTDKSPSEGWEEDDPEPAPKKEKKQAAKMLELDDILG